MKDFILDSTYKDATIINSNGDIFTTSCDNLPCNPIAHHTVYLSKVSSNYSSNQNKNDKFNVYDFIDYL